MAIENRADINEADLVRSEVFIDLFHRGLRCIVELEDESIYFLPQSNDEVNVIVSSAFPEPVGQQVVFQ